MRLSDLLSSYQAEYVPQTISQSRAKSAIKHLMSINVDASDLNEADLVRYRIERCMAQGSSPSTANRELAVLGSAYKWAGLPCLKIPRTREIPRPDAITEHQVQKIIDAAHNLQTKAFAALLFTTGQRFEAVQKLKRSQIVNGVIEFEQGGGEFADRRKRRSRCPLSPELRKILSALEKAFGKTEYVIPCESGEGYCRSLSRWFRTAAERAGVKASAHTLRHSSATIALNNGASLYEVSCLLGHSSTQITERVYVKRQPRQIEKVVGMMGGLVKL